MAKGIRFKKDNENAFVDKFYRVGDLYLTTNSTNPSTIFGGTWELFGPGRTLVCVNTNDTDFNTVKKTGGNKTHTHRYGFWTRGWYGTLVEDFKLWNGSSWIGTSNSTNNNGITTRETTNTAANNPAQNMEVITDTGLTSSLQPFITCYIWIRTA